MRWTGNVVLAVVVATGLGPARALAQPAPATNINVAMPTCGGKQFWTDRLVHHDWRIQQNVYTGHCRLLDGNDVRRAWGTHEGCRQEFEQLRLPEELPPVRGKVVVTVHGLGRSRQSLAGMGEYLAKEGGFTWINFSYASTRDSIDAHGKALGQVIGELNEAEEVHFVAHSLGNLVVRRYLAERALAEPEARRPPLGRFVMLAPPNQGAQLAARMGDGELYRLILGASGSQLAAGWDDVEPRLAIPPCPFGIVAGGGGDGGLNNPLLEGDDDLVVTVAETRLPGAADFVVVPVWHACITDAPVVRQYTLRFLQNGYFVSPQARQPITSP
ncbi:MAG: lipase [Thermoguttaceae bacterium]|nr:lipase [Thermoguttaceae bacterium]